MVTVSVQEDRLRLEMEGRDKFWSLRSQLEFPLSHVQSVRQDPEPALGWWHGFRAMGTNVPGVLTAGTFWQHGGAVFYDVRDPERTIVFELEHEHYQRLVVEVKDPAATVALVTTALGQR